MNARPGQTPPIGDHLRVGPIEAIDGTPVVDVKPALGAIAER